MKDNVEVEVGEPNVEVEVRSFISGDEYNRLMKFFKDNAEFLGEDDQVTFYFSGDEDIRIQKNSKFAKVWMKRGKIHDEHREEIEVKFKTEDFDKMFKIFTALGYEVEVKWLRKRNSFRWDDIDVMIDHTKAYGYIIELEKMAGDDDKDKTYQYLRSKLESLGIEITPREKFETRFKEYKEKWKELL
jgi:predicted adenylyl cyclase CyaB